MRKEFAGAAPKTELAANLPNTTTTGGTFSVVDGAGYPTGVNPFVVVIARGAPSEEKILCSARSANTLTVQARGYDGTTAQTHSAGVSVHHGLDSVTIDDVNAHAFDPSRDDHSQYLTAARRNFVTVAPSDASASVKAGANYVCSGANDHVQIQAALDAHGRVRMLAGSFSIGATISVDANEVLEGEGQATVLTLQNGVNQTAVQATGGGFIVRNFQIQGNGANQTANVHGMAAGGSLWTVYGVHVYNAHYIGIQILAGSKRWTVDDCVVDTTLNFLGITVYGDAVNVTEHGRVTNCFVTNTFRSGITIQGFASHITFAGNHTKDTGEDGVTGYNAANRYINFLNNLIDNPGNHGSHIGGNYITYANNRVTTPVHSGCYAHNHDDTTMMNVTIIGNSTTGNTNTVTGYGFYAFDVDNLVLSGNNAENVAAHGLFIKKVVKFSVTGNNVKGANYGLRLQGAKRGAATGNMMNQLAGHGISLQTDGTTDHSLYVTVTGNSVSEAGGNFIVEASGSNYNVIVANVGFGNTNPLSTSGAGTVNANNVDV